MKENLICPICKSHLIKNNKSIVCSNNHCFDISKSGYINLLPVDKKKSKFPGDNKTMIDARAEFLNKGYFNELAKKIQQVLNIHLNKESTILDAGCGTGYYLNSISNDFSNLYGVDISKDAVLTASKNCNKNITFIVSSIFDIPLKNSCCDCILNIFAPKATEEFKRLLTSNGVIIEVTPGENHLFELKEIVYGENAETNNTNKALPFTLIETYSISYQNNVENHFIEQLFKMTPYFYSTKKEDIAKLNNINNVKITFDFIIKVYKI